MSTEEKVPDVKIENPLDKLNDEQKKKLKELRSITDGWENVAEKERKFMDDMCLFRFLSGLNWDIKTASAHLKETIEWRAKFNPEGITLKDVEKVAKTGYLFDYGFDKECRPVVYMIMRKDTVPNDEEGQLLKFKNVVYIMEKCIKKMKPGVYNMCWIIDVKDASLSLSTVKQVKDMFTKMGDYYTERLGRCIVINYSFTMGLIWNFVKPFLAPETVAKYQLMKGGKDELLPAFTKYVDKSQLIQEFYGDAKYVYDFDKLLKQEQESLQKK